MKSKKILILITMIILGIGTTYNLASAEMNTITFENPLAPIDSLEGLLKAVLSALMNVIIILAIIFLVIGAIMYMTSAGNEKQIEKAKNTITASMIGLAIALAAPSFLKEIAGIINNPSGDYETALTLRDIAINTLRFLLSIVGIIAIISLVIGGIMYMTAGGDNDQIEKAKKIVTYAIIGTAIALGSLVIVQQIANIITG